MKKLFIIGLTALLIPGILTGCSKAEQAEPLPVVEDQVGTVLPADLEETVDEARMIAEELETESEEIVEVLETQVEEAEAQLGELTALSEKLEAESQETLAVLKEKMNQVTEMEPEELIEEVDMDVVEEAVADLEEEVAQVSDAEVEEVLEEVDMDVAEEAVADLEEEVIQVSDAEVEEVLEDIDMDAIEENLKKLLAAEEAEEMNLEETGSLIEEESDNLVTGSEPTDLGAETEEVSGTAVTEDSETPIS